MIKNFKGISDYSRTTSNERVLICFIYSTSQSHTFCYFAGISFAEFSKYKCFKQYNSINDDSQKAFQSIYKIIG